MSDRHLLSTREVKIWRMSPAFAMAQHSPGRHVLHRRVINIDPTQLRMVQLHRDRTAVFNPWGPPPPPPVNNAPSAAMAAAAANNAVVEVPVEELTGVSAAGSSSSSEEEEKENDCCVCFEPVAKECMRETFTCSEQHWVCRSCRPKVRRCPLCRQGK